MASTEMMPHEPQAQEALAWSRRHVDPALRAAIDTLPEDMRHIAGYHFGWWDEHGQPIQAGSGKTLRSALLLLTAEAVGGSVQAAVPAAVAVELVHNFSLIHDDVIDTDATRRHRPTAWSAFGISAAILAGDALLTLASGVLAGSGHPAALPGMRLLNTAVQELIQGQVMDLSFEQRSDVDLAECQHMAQAKTATLLAAACELGALFAGASSERTEHLRNFGHELGVAFQHVDDLLGIWGDPQHTGKPAYSDVRAGKKTLPVVFALNSDTPAGNELASRYHHDTPHSATELTETAELVDHAGGRAWSQTQADQRLTQALQHLHAASPVTRATELDALARLVTHRDH
ncbi:family 2 encapsulin nanocompartment cargo protein polyprenyl transferase [Haloactinomyces albus]|uniref:Geranylgeranyl diphosphate synthase type I n=1 Tax=Haloactinomyces albus TaxID=1352928 RepID=A0AAE3ZJ64_9ACTN|nr:family 2 encapsulin nanocompartment cargo protein polyprenyl transferase [Haloactinomyces albus]MDR7304655.1 geranylgeranyl diphosphate synthase type I [Haloactinomyces albus]